MFINSQSEDKISETWFQDFILRKFKRRYLDKETTQIFNKNNFILYFTLSRY